MQENKLQFPINWVLQIGIHLTRGCSSCMVLISICMGGIVLRIDIHTSTSPSCCRNGPLQYEDPSGKLMMLPTDMALIWDKKFKK